VPTITQSRNQNAVISSHRIMGRGIENFYPVQECIFGRLF